MKKIIYLIGFGTFLAILLGCNATEQTTWDKYKDWREMNNAWLAEMQTKTNPDGSPYYTVIVPEWNPASFVLIHYFNDRKETEGNLSPLYSSFTDCRYRVVNCENTPIDSSTLMNSAAGPGIYRSQVSSNVQGFSIALMDMRCGDTAEVCIPYGLAYGSQERGEIKPYSNLKFNIRLVDIPFYEVIP